MTIALLTEIILADAEKEAARLEAAARRESERAMVDGERRAERRAAELLEQARRDMEFDKKRRLAAAKLAARDKLISAKQSLIERVFLEAKDRLDQLSEEAYIDFAYRMLIAHAAGGEEIIFDHDASPPSVRDEIVNRANRSLTADGKAPVVAAPAGRKFGRGFILRAEKIESGFTFGSLIQTAREDFESKVAELLFARETK